MELSRKELFKYFGILGIVALVGGYLHYNITEIFNRLNGAFMIVGGALLLLYIASNYQEILDSSQKRSTRLGANASVFAVAGVAIFALVNYLGYQHHKKFDYTTEKQFTLSDQTKKIAGDLKSEIKVLYFSKSDEPVANLVERYRDFSNKITYERIDLQARPEMAQQYRGMKGAGEVVVISGQKNEKLMQGADEEKLTSAIMKVTREKAKAVCFIDGHGEHELAGAGPEGYQFVDGKLKSDNYETKTINLVTSNQVPPECAVAILAGPKKAMLPAEIEMVKKYLSEGGKVFVGLDPDSEAGITDWLKEWNIEARADTVVDVSGAGRAIGMGPAVPLVQTYGTHPITTGFRTPSFYPLARSLKIESKGDIATTELLKSTPQSFGESDLKGNEAKFDEGKDTKGPLTLGATATKKVGDKEARLIVVGDSDFASNAYAKYAGNGDLFLNSINWLAQEEDLISIRPKGPTNRNVELSETAKNIFFWISVVLMPLAMIISGIVVWRKRR